jgi:oxygen-dependent protoporphyrinogen oxidase
MPVRDQGQAVDLLVVGGGIAGLAAAWAAHRRGWTVAVLEAEAVVGGKLRTDRIDGYLCEWGPHTFLGSAHTLWRLIDELGLHDQVVASLPPGDRFVFRGGRARRLPSDPGSALRGDFLSWRGKLRVAAEPFITGAPDPDETVLEFARRRLGDEAARYLIAPFVAGIHAGQAGELGLADAFPKLARLEAEAGSLVLGALLGVGATPSAASVAAEQTRRPGQFSFADGMGTLAQALATALPKGAVHTGAAVRALRAAGRQWQVATDTGSWQAARLALAVPPKVAAQLLMAAGAAVIDELAQVPLAQVALVHLGGPDPRVLAPRGFGVLTAPGEPVRAMGMLWPSSLFAGRAPVGHWLHAVFMGGSADPAALDLSDEALVAQARADQQATLAGLTGGAALELDFARVVRWREAIPQYLPGHRARMQQARAALEARWPSLALAGNYLEGVSLDDAARSGVEAVARLARPT